MRPQTKAAFLMLATLTSAQAEDVYIQPMIPGTSLPDLAGPGLRVKDGVIYETYPGPMGIINPMGTTYKREGDELVPHTSILGPRDFEKPSYRIEREFDLNELDGDY
jgi:hypothetical protein